MPVLVAFAGLPGTGKTTLSHVLASRRRAVLLRIDTIEQAMRAAELPGAPGPAGYLIAYALAETNLRLGLDVVADCVNPLTITRDAWRDTARSAGAALVEVEVICSDPVEHRRRVEHRRGDIDGLMLPRWSDVTGRQYDAWDRDHIIIDTATMSADVAVACLLQRVEATPIRL